MEKEAFVHTELDWEVYKYLSRHVLTDDELDIYWFLTYYFLEKNELNDFFDNLKDLLYRAVNEKITVNENIIKEHIKSFDMKKSLE
ncbi:MAG: hypothetical protein E7596_01005 [Ruminococcaceae bacterium]|nr:hypothetical protein [Oscillospiraceae bacterium]